MMYFDASYLLKCYVKEKDSDKVGQLANEGGAIACCIYGKMEIVAALHRKLREAEITRDTFDIILKQMEFDDEQRLWHWFPLTTRLLESVCQVFRTVPESLFLRTADALHLVCARDNGFSEIYSNDRHLLEASNFFNLKGCNVISAN